MTESYNGKCPLCDAISSYNLCDGGNIYLYHCNTCADYFISRSAAKWINKHETHRKLHLSKVAASYKGKEKMLALTTVVGETLHQEEVPHNKYRCK